MVKNHFKVENLTGGAQEHSRKEKKRRGRTGGAVFSRTSSHTNGIHGMARTERVLFLVESEFFAVQKWSDERNR
jgi:hypothetical protein